MHGDMAAMRQSHGLGKGVGTMLDAIRSHVLPHIGALVERGAGRQGVAGKSGNDLGTHIEHLAIASASH